MRVKVVDLYSNFESQLNKVFEHLEKRNKQVVNIIFDKEDGKVTRATILYY
ncbi:hypothetical protein [Salinicoccus roseus]|uniref:DUF4264 domain-containing protein n=1 Tax=Salinicoccus roseus TaxID=45670 RepID=A0ABT4YKZ0_9STAP|nr:hypothetical protein [Salinicoccus roseus]MDB0581354.1 hypothetical protein [Salinicoccus roseus]